MKNKILNFISYFGVTVSRLFHTPDLAVGG